MPTCQMNPDLGSSKAKGGMGEIKSWSPYPPLDRSLTKASAGAASGRHLLVVVGYGHGLLHLVNTPRSKEKDFPRSQVAGTRAGIWFS